MPQGKRIRGRVKIKSKYLERNITASFKKSRAKKFLPLIYDPKGHGLNPKPTGIYYRILKRGNEEAIQYFIHWMTQDCTWAYPGVGYLFSHKFDYEPITAFIKNDKIIKLAISAAGNILQGGHQTEIFREDESVALGKVTYKTSKSQAYPYGINEKTGHFKEESINKVVFKKNRPVLGLATCYHVYTTVQTYLKKPKLDLELYNLTDEILSKWYDEENFGHDVSNPWKYPHMRYHPSPKMRQIIEERTQVPRAWIEDPSIRKGLTYLDKLRSEENSFQFWETLDPKINHHIWSQSQYLMYVLYSILQMPELAKSVKKNNDFYVRAGDWPGKALDRFCILVGDIDNFAYDRIKAEAEEGATDCIALMGIYSLLKEHKSWIGRILRFLRQLFGIKSKTEMYFDRLKRMYDLKLGFFRGGELFKISLFCIFAKKMDNKNWSDILVKRLTETQSDNGGWKTHWIGPTEPRPIGTVENLESTALSIIALYL